MAGQLEPFIHLHTIYMFSTYYLHTLLVSFCSYIFLFSCLYPTAASVLQAYSLILVFILFSWLCPDVVLNTLSVWTYSPGEPMVSCSHWNWKTQAGLTWLSPWLRETGRESTMCFTGNDGLAESCHSLLPVSQARGTSSVSVVSISLQNALETVHRAILGWELSHALYSRCSF